MTLAAFPLDPKVKKIPREIFPVKREIFPATNFRGGFSLVQRLNKSATAKLSATSSERATKTLRLSLEVNQTWRSQDHDRWKVSRKVVLHVCGSSRFGAAWIHAWSTSCCPVHQHRRGLRVVKPVR